MICSLLLMAGRSCAGVVIIYAGAQLVRGEGLLAGTAFDSRLTGAFVIILGVYSLYQGVIVWLIDRFGPGDQPRRQ